MAKKTERAKKKKASATHFVVAFVVDYGAVDEARANAIIWTSVVWFALIVLAVAFKGF